MTIFCPYCRGEMASASDLVGQQVACPHCQQPFVMPGQRSPELLYLPHPVTAQSPPPPPPFVEPSQHAGVGAWPSQVSPIVGINSRFCFRCGAVLFDDAAICPMCGVLQESAHGSFDDRKATKDPGIAAMLSLFVPGAGQMYAGHVGRGLCFFFVSLVGVLTILLLIPAIAVWIWSIFDAYNCARDENRRNSIRRPR